MRTDDVTDRRVAPAGRYRGFRIPLDASGRPDIRAISGPSASSERGTSRAEVLSLVMRSGAWDRSAASAVAAPVVRHHDRATRLLGLGLGEKRVPGSVQGPVVNAWKYLLVIRRLADFGDWSVPNLPFGPTAGEVLEGFVSAPVPEAERPLIDGPRLFHAVDFDRIDRVAFSLHPPWWNGLDGGVEFHEQLYRTVVWGEIGLARSASRLTDRDLFVEHACLPVRFELVAAGRGEIRAVVPSGTADQPAVTIHASCDIEDIFPLRVPTGDGSAFAVIGVDEVTIDETTQTATLPLPAGTSGGLMEYGPPYVKVAVSDRWVRSPATSTVTGCRRWYPLAGVTAPQLTGVVLHPVMPDGPIAALAARPDESVTVPADAELIIELEIANRPEVVRVVGKGPAHGGEVGLVQLLGDGATGVVQLALPAPEAAKETFTVVYEIRGSSGAGHAEERIGEFAVTRTVEDPSLMLTATVRDLLVPSDRMFPAVERRVPDENGQPLVVLSDEPVTLTIEGAAGTFGKVHRLAAEARDRHGSWRPIGEPRLSGLAPKANDRHRVSALLDPGTTALRATMDLGEGRQLASATKELSVLAAPVFLICLAKGGSEISSLQPLDGAGEEQNGGGGGGGGGDQTSCQPSSGHHSGTGGSSSDGDQICDLDDEIGTRRLGLRLLDEGLARELRVTTADGTCIHRTNPGGTLGTIICGAFNNSFTDGADDGDHFTWQGQLTAQADAVTSRGVGKDHVIFVGHSHGGAAFAHIVRDDWSWQDELDVELFISIDSTDEGGAIEHVGSVPKRLVNFYQDDSLLWFQNGAFIDTADVTYNLSGWLSHTDMDSGYFVQCRSAQAVRETVGAVRERYRRRYAADAGVTATAGGPHTLDVFVRGRHGDDLVHKHLSGGQWSGWINLGGDLASAPAVTSGGPHDLDVFVRGAHDDDLVWRYLDGGQWSGWINLGGDLAGAPAVTSGGPHDLDVFVRGAHDDDLVWRYLDGGRWSGWFNLGGDLG
jgi:hypothetical protein